jgi:hypothetical protein
MQGTAANSPREIGIVRTLDRALGGPKVVAFKALRKRKSASQASSLAGDDVGCDGPLALRSMPTVQIADRNEGGVGCALEDLS